jgi:eukaryotic-like serine/threonine-protein kinase
MSQRFVRCGHCGLPHPVTEAVCPKTGLAMGHVRQTPGSARPAPPPAPPPSGRSPVTSGSNAHRRNLIGRTVDGKYRFISVLGEGGMGTVFEAENILLGRAVAVKVLHPAQARKTVAVKRFHQEARAAGKIGHPNICEVYDLGTLDDGAPFLVMEKLVGVTLADRIGHEGGLPFEECVDVVNQVLSGLVAAHEKGIVHRDIKPENVFLTQRAGCPPLVKLLDFGVSKMIAPDAEELDLTRTGMVMGTPFYMSPEQARGDRNLDARVDLWACGVILYEALTGRRPFIAANYNALLLQILTGTPKPARELRPSMPEGFDAVLDRAMARSREQRYPSAILFQRDLATLRARYFDATAPPPPMRPRSQPVPAQPPMVPSRPASRAQPSPVPPPPQPQQATSPRRPTPPPSGPVRERAPLSSSDPLNRLPSLEARYDDEPHDTTAKVSSGRVDAEAASEETSGTHPVSGSDELPFNERPYEDDSVTEIAHQTWDDETRRMPKNEMMRAAVKAMGPKPAPAPRAPSPRSPPGVEDTVKIEGDIEAHFAKMHPEQTEQPRPRPKRR